MFSIYERKLEELKTKLTSSKKELKNLENKYQELIFRCKLDYFYLHECMFTSELIESYFKLESLKEKISEKENTLKSVEYSFSNLKLQKGIVRRIINYFKLKKIFNDAKS